jgi:hypothetical protein
MATRAGAPEFTLHDLRKLLASVGARLQIGDAILRRILGHAPKRGDVLHRHYVSLEAADIGESLQRIQSTVVQFVGKTDTVKVSSDGIMSAVVFSPNR